MISSSSVLSFLHLTFLGLFLVLRLLAILSKTREPSAVQPHLRKCFDSIISIQFNKPPLGHEVLAMVSAEGEVVPFFEKVGTDKGVVEDWLNALELMMQVTIRNLCQYVELFQSFLSSLSIFSNIYFLIISAKHW